MSSRLLIRTIGPENLTEFHDGQYLVRQLEQGTHYYTPSKPVASDLTVEDWTYFRIGDRYRVPIMRIIPDKDGVAVGFRLLHEFMQHFERKIVHEGLDVHIIDVNYDVYLLKVDNEVEGIGIVAYVK